jgi:hypothetical protein
VILPSGLSVGRASAGVSAPERSGPLDPAWSPAPAPAESSVVRSELEQERQRWAEASRREATQRWADAHGRWVESSQQE